MVKSKLPNSTAKEYLYTASKSVGDGAAGDATAPQCDYSSYRSGEPGTNGFTTTNSGGVANGRPGVGCPVSRWVDNISTNDNTVTPPKWDGTKVIPPDGGIQACTNVCDKDFNELNICVPVDWDPKQGKPTECIKTNPNIKKNDGRLDNFEYLPKGCTFDEKQIKEGKTKCDGLGYNTWCPEGYKPGTNLKNGFAVPMTNPIHFTNYCKSNHLSKGALIGIIVGSVVGITSIILIILVLVKKNKVVK